MLSLLRYSSLCAAFLISLAGADDALTKPILSPVPPGTIDQGLSENLPLTHSTRQQWIPGWLPSDCKKLAAQNGIEDATKFEVFNVLYDDCDTFWTFCRHKDSPMSQDFMVDTFGRIPVKMRSFVTHIISVNGTPSALNYGGPIILFGEFRLDELVHEVGHSIDHSQLESGALQETWFSQTDTWLHNYKLDSAVWDGYAATDQQENFAQEVVVALFDKNVPGGIGRFQRDWDKIYHQYSTIEANLKDKLLPGGCCSKRLPDSPPVSMVDSAKFRARKL